MACALRIFIARQSNIESWINDGRKILRYIKDDDYLYLIKNEQDELSFEKEAIINELKGRNKLDEIVVSDENLKGIFDEINERNSKNSRLTEDTNFYFIQYNELCSFFQENRLDITEKYKDFINTETYRVPKKGSKTTPREYGEVDLLAKMATGIAPMTEAREQKEAKQEENKEASVSNESSSEEKKENPKKPTKEELNSKLKDKLKKLDGKKADASNYTVKEIEDKIFGKEFSQVKVEYKYTELDDTKAKLMYLLNERFNNHLFILLPDFKKFTFSDDELTIVCNIFARSKDFDSFIQLWKSKYPTKILNTEGDFKENYMKLKREADFYKDVSNYLYLRDEF